MSKNNNYKVVYKILKPDVIFNHIELKRKHEKRREEGRLPEYMKDFFDNLEKSVLKEGFRNPIMVSALKFNKKDGKYHYYNVGKSIKRFQNNLIPLEYQKDNNILICYRQGGSRLWVAQKHKINIPCLISDYCDFFPDLNLNLSEILKHFKDTPHLRFTSAGLIADNLPLL